MTDALGPQPGSDDGSVPVGLSRGTPDSIIRLLVRPSGWRRIKLFGASANASRQRRRVDTIVLVWHVVALLILVPTTRTVTGFEAALTQAVAALPSIVAPVAGVPYDLLAVWAVAVIGMALIRRHGRLAASLFTAIPVSLLVTVAVNRTLDPGAAGEGLRLGLRQGGVPVQLVLALALTTVASRELSRPFRLFGRRLALAATIGAVLLPVASPYRVLCAVLIAGAATAVVRMLFGSPATTVSMDDVRYGLRDLGVEAEPVANGPRGVMAAVLPDGGRVAVAVKGRDEWDTQLLVTLWRLAWYRNSGSNLQISARHQTEHQAFLMLMAERRGAPVTPVLAAGASRTGDAILATRVDGTPLGELDPARVDDALLGRIWKALDDLHQAGVAHGALDPAAVLVEADGSVTFGRFDRAQAIQRINQVHADDAQLLVTTAVVVGAERAIPAALAVVGEEGAAPVVAHLQAAALDDRLRRAVDAAGLKLDDLRAATAEAAGIEVPDLQKIWRVSWGAVIRLVLIGFVGYVLITQLADIGFDTIADAIREASLPILLFALLLGQTPRVASAGSLQTASPAPVPLERVTRLQFAICFINLAVPSTAARAATSIRFFQRSGSTAAGAVSAGALDSVFGFIAQVVLLGGLLLFGVGTLGFDPLSGGSGNRSGLFTAVAVLLGLIVVGAVVAMIVPKLRAKVTHFLGQLREALLVLRSPAAVVRLLAFNILAELLFSLTIWTVLRAFGQHVGLADVIVINEVVALFAGLVPVPGGVGVTEGALTAGFVSVGVPQEIAFSAALTYRMCTFYLPPIWGYFALSSLRKHRFL